MPVPGATAPPADLRLRRGEWLTMGSIFAAIAATTVLAFVAVYLVSSRWPVVAGLGLVAYVLGLRHGFDADHIAAIDNTTRKLIRDGRRPLTVGTWFSLGHSTVVCGMIVALVLVTQAVTSHLEQLRTLGSVIGTLVSGAFLVVIGLVNVLIVVEIAGMFHAARRGEFDEGRYEAELSQRGFLYRYFYRLFRIVREPWQIYPIGVLFGLGFDTATEVALIALSVGLGVGVAGSAPLWTILLLPLLFTCGMVLSDTSDGFAMRYAYGWAFEHPIRKIFYNLTLTVISVLVAFAVGGLELLGVLASELGWSGPFWGALRDLSGNFELVGYAVVALFVGAWLVALAIYRWKGYERRLLPPGPPERRPNRGGGAGG